MRARLLAVVGLCVLSLSGCGSTIVTRVHSRDILDHSRIGQGPWQARRIEKRSGVPQSRPRSLEEAAQALARWAGSDPDRLTLAAEAILDMRPRGSESIQGFALSAVHLASKSLETSGVPASRWLTTDTTRKSIAIYNAALERFVARNPEELARGISERNVPTALGRILVSSKYFAHAPFRAGYFDTFIQRIT